LNSLLQANFGQADLDHKDETSQRSAFLGLSGHTGRQWTTMATTDTTASMVKAPYTQLHPLPAGVVAVYSRDFDVIDATYVRTACLARLPYGRC